MTFHQKFGKKFCNPNNLNFLQPHPDIGRRRTGAVYQSSKLNFSRLAVKKGS
jgi:hypothetical protein